MSDNVLSCGYMAPLLKPVDYEEMSESLYENSVLQLNYDGTLVYDDDTKGGTPFAGMIL